MKTATKIIIGIIIGFLIVGGCALIAATEQPDTGYPSPAEPSDDETESDDGSISDGVYLVGTDIKAGTWVTPGPGSGDGILDLCYWARNKDDSGDLGSIISNDNLTGQGRVTVHEGEIFELSGGCNWRNTG